MEIEKRADPKENGPSFLKSEVKSAPDKQYRCFCEKHRPLKIVKEIEERD